MNLSVSEIISILKNDIQDISNPLPDGEINSFKIDSRKIVNNDVFIAIQGSNVDGHDYIDNALENGACLVITNRSHKNSSVLTVRDSVKSLGVIANYYIKKLKSESIGITGTNGKSTVTAMIASIMQLCFKTSQTLGNYNNQIGLPLSVLASDVNTEIFDVNVCKKEIYKIVN